MSFGIPLFFAALTKKGKRVARVRPAVGCVAIFCVLSACAAPIPPAGINDPDEAKNREIHAFNVALDKSLVRPISQGYGKIPVPVQRGVSNFSGNLDLPGEVVNHVLQGRPGPALQNTLRFAVNTVVGIGGLFDPATAIGIPEEETDFGETLHVWGAGEGAYVVLPVLGASTERDAVGTIVDIVMNPVSRLVPSPESYIGTAAKVGSKLGDRGRFAATIDSILYGSADGYAQMRLLYLEKRRYELGQTGGVSDDNFEDPYAE